MISLLYIYVGCFTFGILFSAISFIFGHHGGDHGFDFHAGDHGFDLHGAEVDHGADLPSPFSPLVLSSAIIAFGAIGIIAKVGFAMEDLASALVSVGLAGAVGAAIFFGIVKFMYSSQSNSTFSQEDLIGIEVEVLTPIPLNGVGEIVYVINGERHSLPARSFNGQKADRGETLMIKEITSNVAVVARKFNLEDIVVGGEDAGSESEIDP